MIQQIKRIPGVTSIYRVFRLAPIYHYLLAFLGAAVYGFPSRRMVVIGVTGTKGKTTTCNLIAHILNAADHKTGLATTVNFRIGEEEWVNDTKQTMLGRFALQKLLKRMAAAGCEYAVVETSSEGVLQFRHRFINYHVAVFTNLSPEHIERHGSFEKYRAAKVKLFAQVARKKDGVGVYNLDDPNIDYFLRPPVAAQYGYALRTSPAQAKENALRVLQIKNIRLSAAETEFELGGDRYLMPLLGEFNVLNAAAAICVALSRLIPPEKIKAALETARPAPGRLEFIDKGQDFRVIVDYAHEPASLTALYETVKTIFKPRRVIGLLGSQGGGRDKAKRAEMGRLAANFCDTLILTNEDPYDEPPEKIVEDIERAARAVKNGAEILKIIDRREAIRQALKLAAPGDAVVISGKGGEVWMCVAAGKMIPWNDRRIVEEALEESKQGQVSR